MAITTRVIEGGRTSITQPYHINGEKGYDYDHWGIDLTGYNGSYNVLAWVLAHSAGTVVEYRNDCTGYEDNSYGNYVLLRHDNGMYTMYAHGSYNTVQVRTGQRVAKGQRLFYMGNTGHSFGGHLHFEIRRSNGYKIDPEPYLNSDLPSGSSVSFTYQVWDDMNETWQPNVVNDEDYAGVLGSDVDCVYVDCNVGNVRYAVHTWRGDQYEKYPDSGWLPEVKNREDYAGMYGRPIDAFILKSDKPAKYRVHLRKSGQWLDWVRTQDASYQDEEHGYAGIIGEPIDAIEIMPI